MVRPLETLHNALSLRQLDAFLSFVTSANFKTSSSGYLPTPPSCKPKASLSTVEFNEENTDQSKHKRSIPPYTLGLTSSQDSSSKYHFIFLNIFKYILSNFRLSVYLYF